MAEESAAPKRLKIAVMASGSGTTLQAVIDACEDGSLNADVVVVISNNSASGAIARAGKHGIPAVHLSSHTHPDPAALDRAIADTLQVFQPDVILLAGYMKKLGPSALSKFRDRVINTHPSLLPKHGGHRMYGGHVHAAVVAGGEAVTGISVHLVDADYDTGRVLAQCEVEVLPTDDAAALARRVQSFERPFLIDVLRQIARGEISLSA